MCHDVFCYFLDFYGWPGSGRNLSRPTGLATLIKHCAKFSPGDPLLRTFRPQSMNPDDSYVSLLSTSLPVVLATSIRAARWVICSGRHSTPHRPRVAMGSIHVGWRLFVFMRWSLHPTPTPGGTCFCPCGRDAPHRPGWHFCDQCGFLQWRRSKTCVCMPRMCTNISHMHVKHRPLGIRGFPLSATLNTRSGLSGFIRVYPGLSGHPTTPRRATPNVFL